MSYIDFLPIELRNIILTYYISETNHDIYYFKNTLNSFNLFDFRKLYYTIFHQYKDVTIDELHPIYLANNETYLMLLYYIPKMETDNRLLVRKVINNHSSSSLINYSNIIYRYKLKQKFPQFYNLIKDLDLVSIRSGSVLSCQFIACPEFLLKVNQGWKGLYWRLTYTNLNYRKRFVPWLSNTLINFLKTGELPENYICEISGSELYNNSYNGDFMVYVLYGMMFHPNFKFEKQDPYLVFVLLALSRGYNSGAYEKIRELIPNKVYKNILNDPSVASQIEENYDNTSVFDINENNTFIDYIRNKVK